MASPLVSWIDETFDYFGQPIPLRLKVPSFRDAGELIKRIREIRAQPVSALFEAPNLGWIEEMLSKAVKMPEPIELDGITIRTGPDLLDAVSIGFVLKLLDKLGGLAFMTEQEGKVSASPSTPSAGNGSATDGSSFPVPSTEPVAGPTP